MNPGSYGIKKRLVIIHRGDGAGRKLRKIPGLDTRAAPDIENLSTFREGREI